LLPSHCSNTLYEKNTKLLPSTWNLHFYFLSSRSEPLCLCETFFQQIYPVLKASFFFFETTRIQFQKWLPSPMSVTRMWRRDQMIYWVKRHWRLWRIEHRLQTWDRFPFRDVIKQATKISKIAFVNGAQQPQNRVYPKVNSKQGIHLDYSVVAFPFNFLKNLLAKKDGIFAKSSTCDT